MKIKYYFQKDFQTSDNQELESLRTHYYHNKKEEVIEVVKAVLTDMKSKIASVDLERGEIIFNNLNFNGTATITAVSYMEIAVDFIVSGFNILPTAYGKKVIERLYKNLDQKLHLKGISLYK